MVCLQVQKTARKFYPTARQEREDREKRPQLNPISSPKRCYKTIPPPIVSY